MAIFLGIDYGSKQAGTTALCYLENDKLHVVQSEKNKDADQFILKKIEELTPKSVFIDAPLSLPIGYFKKDLEEFFYRECDKELGAMSPMFLGGLTARAVKLKTELQKSGIEVYETYPGFLARNVLKLKVYNKKEKLTNSAIIQITGFLPFEIQKPIKNWHQFDSILAWLSGWRFLNHEAESFGNQKEGLIWV